MARFIEKGMREEGKMKTNIVEESRANNTENNSVDAKKRYVRTSSKMVRTLIILRMVIHRLIKRIEY